MDRFFWNHKRVLVTGHTGFKGSWLTMLLKRLGAEVYGYSLPPCTNPSLYQAGNIQPGLSHEQLGDIRNLSCLESFFQLTQPEIIMHLAAQPLVLSSFEEPLETFSTNIMGTAHVLEASLKTSSVRTVLVVTSDKCYENFEWPWAYRETDPMGGHDPYSASKGCSEILANSYRKSYFNARNIPLITVRAGNVIGGGDWSQYRLVPDIMRAAFENVPLVIRSSGSIRPWQHVLEPLSGYLELVEASYQREPLETASGWNFGPDSSGEITVAELVESFLELLKKPRDLVQFEKEERKHEAKYLKLDSSKVRTFLAWKPRLSTSQTLSWTAEWYERFYQKEDAHKATLDQIDAYLSN